MLLTVEPGFLTYHLILCYIMHSVCLIKNVIGNQAFNQLVRLGIICNQLILMFYLRKLGNLRKKYVLQRKMRIFFTRIRSVNTHVLLNTCNNSIIRNRNLSIFYIFSNLNPENTNSRHFCLLFSHFYD